MQDHIFFAGTPHIDGPAHVASPSNPGEQRRASVVSRSTHSHGRHAMAPQVELRQQRRPRLAQHLRQLECAVGAKRRPTAERQTAHALGLDPAHQRHDRTLPPPGPAGEEHHVISPAGTLLRRATDGGQRSAGNGLMQNRCKKQTSKGEGRGGPRERRRTSGPRTACRRHPTELGTARCYYWTRYWTLERCHGRPCARPRRRRGVWWAAGAGGGRPRTPPPTRRTTGQHTPARFRTPKPAPVSGWAAHGESVHALAGLRWALPDRPNAIQAPAAAIQADSATALADTAPNDADQCKNDGGLAQEEMRRRGSR